jgi:arylsulfatase A-like enzyme
MGFRRVGLNRREFVAALASSTTAATIRARAEQIALAAESAAAPSVRAKDAPNILIFMPDQQNGETVLPGSPVVKPNLDRFRRDAVTFDSAHCPAPHCCPSRATFMSGRYPSEHGVFNNVSTNTAIHENPYPGTPFWGNDLHRAGYQLGYSGKLHVGRDVKPETCGFENLCSLEQDTNTTKADDRAHALAQGRKDAANGQERAPGEIIRPGWPNLLLYKTLPNSGSTGYEDLADTKIVRAGIEGMRRMAKSGQPWCVMVSNSGAHDTYNAPKRFVDLYDIDKIELPESYADLLDDKPRVYQRQRYQYWSQLSEEETRQSLLHYYAKCTLQDTLFGELLDALEATGQADNTIVVYTSDHGDYSAAHGLWMKGVPSFLEAYHVPAMIRWPRFTRTRGERVGAFVEHVDFSSTFLEAAGVQSAARTSGRSLLPWIRGEKPSDWRSATFFQLNGVELYYTQRIVMTKSHKYVYNGFDYDELYDRQADPHEMRNLAFPDLNKRESIHGGVKISHRSYPWPELSAAHEKVRRELLAQMWQFALAHDDTIFNPYGTVALSPYGPGIS